MNILFWVLQILLALHTLMGAIWKFSNSGQAVSTAHPLPHGLWLGMSVIEFLCVIGFILPVFSKSLGYLVPIAAMIIGVEMLFISGWNIFAGDMNGGQIIYWLVVAALCTFIAYGRLVLTPIKPV